jgi:hypothetical protein
VLRIPGISFSVYPILLCLGRVVGDANPNGRFLQIISEIGVLGVKFQGDVYPLLRRREA